MCSGWRDDSMASATLQSATLVQRHQRITMGFTEAAAPVDVNVYRSHGPPAPPGLNWLYLQIPDGRAPAVNLPESQIVVSLIKYFNLLQFILFFSWQFYSYFYLFTGLLVYITNADFSRCEQLLLIRYDSHAQRFKTIWVLGGYTTVAVKKNVWFCHFFRAEEKVIILWY